MITKFKIPEGNKQHTLSGKGNKALYYVGTILLLVIGLPILTHIWEGRPQNPENNTAPSNQTAPPAYTGPSSYPKWIHREGTVVPLPHIWHVDWQDPNQEDTIMVVYENTTDTLKAVHGKIKFPDYPAGNYTFFVNQDSLLLTFTY